MSTWTSYCKIRCNERTTKKPLNKTNIRNNLSQVISDDYQIEQAMNLIVNGFAKDVISKLPMEFAVEANNLLAITLEGSVG